VVEQALVDGSGAWGLSRASCTAAADVYTPGSWCGGGGEAMMEQVVVTTLAASVDLRPCHQVLNRSSGVLCSGSDDDLSSVVGMDGGSAGCELQ